MHTNNRPQHRLPSRLTAIAPSTTYMVQEADQHKGRSTAAALVTLAKLLGRQAAAEFLIPVASPMAPVPAGAAS